MASQNLASAYLDVIDERFYLDSKTDLVVNKGIRLDFQGKNAVTIYNVNTVSETNYQRSGTNRFGSLVELGNGTETFTLSQDKSFTFTVDQGNLEDSMMVTEAAKSVSRQVREVSVPNTDIYRLTTLQAYAVANNLKGSHSGTALSSSNAYTYFLEANATLDESEVSSDNRVCFMTPTTYNLLKLDANFAKACDLTVQNLQKGVIGEVDGVTLVKVPTTYLPANTGFLTVYNKVLVAPSKFDMVRILTEVQGVHGAVAEGRRYYDAFIPTNVGKGMAVHMNA